MISRYKCAGMYGMIAGLVGWLIVMGSLPPPTAAQGATQTQFAWITYGGFTPLDKPRHDSEARFGARPFQFMQKVAIRATYQSDKNYCEVGKLSETGTQFQEIYGWVPQDHFITKSQCLQKNGTTLDEKLLTVFRVAEQGQLLDAALSQSASARELPGEPGKRVKFRAAPGTNAEVLGEYDLYNIYWIFQHVTIKDAEQGRERTYLLVGAGPRFNPNPRDESEMPTSVVKGWVDERQVLTWSTRMARQWDRQSTLPGQTARRDGEGWVYKSPADAYAHDYPEIYRNVLGQEPPSVKYAFVEVFKTDPQLGRVSLEYEPYQMRYPVIDIDDDLAKKLFDGFPKVHPQGQQVNELKMIGAFGGFAGMSNQEVDKMRKYVDNLKQAMKQTEILFVIDDTASMNFSETRDAIAVAIHSIIEEAEQKSHSEVLIATTFFNDTDGHEPGWVPVITRKLEPVKQFGQTIVDIVRRHDLSFGGDAREMVFLGLKKGIEDAEFTPNARRLVVLIGDAGDKSNENDLAEIKKLAEWFEPEREAPIEFLAIQMRLVIESPGTCEAAKASLCSAKSSSKS